MKVGQKHTEEAKARIKAAAISLYSPRLADSVRGGKWITNGIDNRRVPKEHEVPEGWRYGRVRNGGISWGYNFPQDQSGDKSPYRLHREKITGIKFLPVKHPWLRVATAIQRRCKDENIQFGFTSRHEFAYYLNDIAPTHCPVFGFPLSFANGTSGKRGFRGILPSVDRIKPELGYIRGNLQVISFRANVMKSNASEEELQMFAEWILRRNA
jgi:hypothetical protein